MRGGSYKDFGLTVHNIKSAIQYFNKWGWFFDEERAIINQLEVGAQIQQAGAPDAALREVKAA